MKKKSHSTSQRAQFVHGTPGSPSVVKLGDGNGGTMTDLLIEKYFMPYLANKYLAQQDDSVVLSLSNSRIVFSTDSYVVNPIFFPGGNIGSLAVTGTVNDLCVRGADPLYLSASFVIEEGFSLADLETVVKSMQHACAEANVEIVAADTKVVNAGCADQIYITTSGIGKLTAFEVPSGFKAKVGDVVICSGDLGRHGVAVLVSREHSECEISSDCAPLNVMARRLRALGASLHVMRDISRGGLSSALNEIARSSKVGIELDEEAVPIEPAVRDMCELMKLDPLCVASAGRLVALVRPDAENEALKIMQTAPYGERSTTIGRVVSTHVGQVLMRSESGDIGTIKKLSTDQLSRVF